MSGPVTPGARPGIDARRRTLVRGGLLALAAVGFAAGVYVVAAFPPTQASFYPKCTLYQTTGLHCPGCGATRALHALLNGRLEQAAAYNPLALVLLPYALVVGLRSLLRSGERPRTGRRSVIVPWVIAGGLIAFWVLRNVPVYPFTLLAPHDL